MVAGLTILPTLQTMLLLLLLLLLLLQLYTADASPFGSLSCAIGQAGVGGSHLSASDIQTGPVSLETGFLFSLDDQLPMLGKYFQVSAKEPHTLSLFSVQDGQAIRGFSYVMSYDPSVITNGSPEVNLENVFVLEPGAAQQNNNMCSSDDNSNNNVVGLTHTSADAKSEVITTLFFEEAIAPVVNLDVTVVVQNSDGASIYYYSFFRLEVLDVAVNQEAPTSEENAGGGVTVDVALREYPDDFSMFLEGLEAASLIEPLRALANMTVLAPTNSAFAQLDASLWEKYLTNADYKYHLLDILQYHVIPDQTLAAAATALGVAAWNGDSLDYQDRTINQGMASVIEPILPISNGVIFGINTVLGRTQLIGTVISLLNIFDEANHNYSILLSLLDAADKTDYLSDSDNTVTIFAANNTAWEAAFSKEELDALKVPENSDQLKRLVNRHVIIGTSMVQDDWVSAGSITTESREELSVDVGSNSSSIAGVTVSSSNFFVTNGVMHAIDAVFLLEEDVLGGGSNDTSNETTVIEGTVVPLNTITECDVCNGGLVDPVARLADGTSCSEWFDSSSNSDAASDSEECLLNRIVGAAYCGCPLPNNMTTTCNICNGTLQPGIGRPVQCGSSVCDPGLECCNASCGTCVGPGGACTQGVCEATTRTDNRQPGAVAVNDVITVEGYIIDQFCLQLGTFLDTGLIVLENADKHTVRCLVDLPPCLASPWEVVLDPLPDDPSGNFTRGFTLDEDSKAFIVDVAKQVGVCETCYGTGTTEMGLRMILEAVVTALGDKEAGSGPVIVVTNVEVAVTPAVEVEGGEPEGSPSIPLEFLDAILPDSPHLTCGALQDLPAVDSDESCNILYEKYGSDCGCPAVDDAMANVTTTQTCQLCDGGSFNANFVFPDGSSCGLLVDESGESQVGSDDDCFFNRAAAAGYCGCSFPAGGCNICNGTFTRDVAGIDLEGVSLETTIPGDIAFTCGDLFALPALDRDDTCGVFQARYARLCGCAGALVDTVQDILEETASIESFAMALEGLNIDKILVDSGRNFTIFAPSNEAVQRDELLQNYAGNLGSWAEHATKILENHIVDGVRLSSGDLWSGAVSSVETLAGELLSVDNVNQAIDNRTMIAPDLGAQNGFVHEIDGILHLPWQSLNILQLLENGLDLVGTSRRLQDENEFVALLGMLRMTSLIEDTAFVSFTENGTTLVAPKDTALAFVEQSGEDRAEDEISNVLLYHVLESNLYEEELANTSWAVLPTRHPFADLLVSRGEDGKYRYNNVILKEEAFARNGIVHATDEFLSPPTMLEFLGYIDDFADVEAGILKELFLAAAWDNGTLSQYMEMGGSERLTLIAPIDAAFTASGFSEEFLDRLVSPQWSRHLQSVLKNLLVESPYSADELLVVQDGPLARQDGVSLSTFETIGGKNASLQIRNIMLSPGAVDGIIHIVNAGFDLPESFPEDAYDYIKSNVPNATVFLNFLDEILLDGNIRDLSAPITVFTPPDFSWDAGYTESMLEGVLQNHIFEGELFFHDKLQGMDGEYLTSVNGKQWIVSNLDGAIFLSSDTGGSTVAILSSSDVLVRNGVIHHLDGILADGETDAPALSPTVDPAGAVTARPTIVTQNAGSITLSPSNLPGNTQPGADMPPTRSPGSSQNCSVCDGSIDTEANLPGGFPCSLWQHEFSQLEAGSDQCLLERAIGVQFCGCVAPESSETCNLCPGTELEGSAELPDARGLTCGAIVNITSVDGPVTCDLLAEKYASYCGCPDAAEPGCSFCESGNPQQRPFILPDATNVTLNSRIFGNLVDTSCQGFADFFSVQTSSTCSNANSQLLLDGLSFDMRAWCECSGAPAQKPCGEFCRKGSVMQDTLVVDEELGLSCQEFSEIFDYIVDESICTEAENLRSACCVIPPVRVNASFVVYNEDGLGASDVSSPSNGRFMNQVFEDFVKTLVADTEGKMHGTTRSRRHLSATLQPSSSEIYAVQTVDCPRESEAPKDAICHNVYGGFNLIVEDEEPAVVLERYENAVDTAIDDGTLQETFGARYPDYPYTVAGLAIIADQPQDQPQPLQNKNTDTSSDNLSWWVILLIVLACLFGLCGLGFLLAYGDTRRKHVKENPDEIQAPLREISVQLLGDNQTTNDAREVEISDSHFWEMNESQPLVDEEGDILDKVDDREQAPVSIIGEEEGTDLWDDENPEMQGLAGNKPKDEEGSWDDDNEEGEWEGEDDGDGELEEDGDLEQEQAGCIVPDVCELTPGDEEVSDGRSNGASEEDEPAVDAPATSPLGEPATGADAVMDNDDELVISDSLKADFDGAMASLDEANQELDDMGGGDGGSSSEMSDDGDQEEGIHDLQADLAKVDGRAFEEDTETAQQQPYAEIVESQDAWRDLQAAVASAPAEEPENGLNAEMSNAGATPVEERARVEIVPGSPPASFNGLNGSFNASFHDM